ncbi:MAG: nucleoside hydrolase [Dehalococcoidia bacterium]|nr:nucleoside hydrolase [Dehalococcoidia bacterium]
MSRVIIDTDPGTDDAIALIAALNSPELDVAALTTVTGNASLQDATRNALGLLTSLRRSDIRVYVGADTPLTGQFALAEHYHGPGGMTIELPESVDMPSGVPADRYIASAAANFDEAITIIALGPLTNVAVAIQRRPEIKDRIKEIFVMGGAVEVGGNVTPYAEFNIYDDPRAANVVFDSGIPITLVGLDVCERVAFGLAESDWKSGASTGERLAARIIEGWFEIHPEYDRYVLCDPLTVAAAIAPDLLAYRHAGIIVEEEGEQKGRTRADYKGTEVKVAVDVDVERARQLILDRLRTTD